MTKVHSLYVALDNSIYQIMYWSIKHSYSYCVNEMHTKRANIFARSHLFESLLLTVTQKCAKKAAVEVIKYCYEEILIELESCRKLQTQRHKHLLLIQRQIIAIHWRQRQVDQSNCGVFWTNLSCHLPDTVNKLQEDRRAICICVILITMTHSLYTQK